MKTIAMIAAAVAILSTASIATPTPVLAGWCTTACGVQPPPRERTREVTCITERRGGVTTTVCY